MHNKSPLLLLSLTLFLGACSDSDDKVNTSLPSSAESSAVELSVPDISSSLVEDFPVSTYVDYSVLDSEIGSIRRIDVNWPSIDVYPYTSEYGYIDGSEDLLTYYLLDNVPSDVDQAYDVERQEDSYWLVNGNNTLTHFDQSSATQASWSLSDSMSFTSIAIDEEDDSNIWLYDSNAHQLVHFNPATEYIQQFILPGVTSILGLSISGDNFLMLGQQSDNAYIVAQYIAQESSLTPVTSWQLEGFDDAEFVDISSIPNGDIVVATSDAENNIFLVADKSAFIGDGPIEDTGELTLIDQQPLPGEIAQPSGIWSLDDGRWLVITDQGDVFILTEDFQLSDTIDLAFNSIECSQGCAEAIASNGNEFFALTDSGLIASFGLANNLGSLNQEYVIDQTNEDGEAYQYAGLGYNLAADEYYLVSEQNDADLEDVLIILNGDFTLQDIYPITYSSEVEGSIYEYDAQGVQYHESYLYVLSQQFTKLLKMDLSGEIVASYDIDNEIVSEPSDFTIRDNQIYIIGDHENDEPVPPISIFTLEEY